ncbi:hypothetical protein C7T86_02605 [Xanthomonas citri pv. malvacearum]|uniref:Uncharacterized protein n=1 Tax=Xanthomonas campestris pv. malvacearum TaxID=86040 RepID=A0AA45BXG0_XANCM|nr:hypothetical protein [Xanthomonas citri]PUE96321.1 hypothetical protein C7T86_02605 [Xanthomonas citri pv. malvacearum]
MTAVNRRCDRASHWHSISAACPCARITPQALAWRPAHARGHPSRITLHRHAPRRARWLVPCCIDRCKGNVSYRVTQVDAGKTALCVIDAAEIFACFCSKPCISRDQAGCSLG